MTDPFAKTRNALYGTVFQHIQFHPMTESTNDDAVKFLGQREAAGLTIATNFQTKGAGRKGREWVAPLGASLLFSTILPVTFEPADLWTIPFWTGMCVQAALKFHNIQPTLQWPNDILLKGRKVGGILCVSRGQGARAWVACGVGINMSGSDDPKYKDIDPPPAFINDASDITRPDLLSAILQTFDSMLSMVEKPNIIARRWEDAAKLKGTHYRVVIDGETTPLEGIAKRLGHHGELVLDIDGKDRPITMADARVLRH
ncbi:MAG: biotin--[acetyl-CoA-carboxylase] ligase [Candidatus Eremiobacteraeota bacterium]|nr:biotin--[acetyl-CoA-carboxylase] ligase [Candidatus Eremiobacteraeota bacterium]